MCLCLSQSSQDYNQTGILQCASLQKVDQQLQSIKQQVDICKLFVMAERTGNGICKHKIYYQSQGHSQELAMGGTKEVVWALGASGSRGKAPVFECKAPRSRKQMLISRYDGGGMHPCPPGYATDQSELDTILLSVCPLYCGPGFESRLCHFYYPEFGLFGNIKPVAI